MNILYAISTKSNLERKTFCVKIAVDLFVRSWVEINRSNQYDDIEVKSTSSWGRELKWPSFKKRKKGISVDLFVRSWVEMPNVAALLEAVPVDLFVRSWVEMFLLPHLVANLFVDLFVRSWVEIFGIENRPTIESASTSSWGRELKLHLTKSQILRWRRPLREVVSWNGTMTVILLQKQVDLFVRSWVEI